MSLVEIVHAGIIQQMDDIAGTIESELKSACPVDSGAARGAIRKEQVSEFVIRIGAEASFPPDGDDPGTHLYYADQGNGGSGRRIFPTRAKALNTKIGFKGMVHGYSGKHFIAAVANRHR